MAFNLPSFRRDIVKRNGQEINNIFEEFIIDIHVQRKDKRSNKLLIHRRV